MRVVTGKDVVSILSTLTDDSLGALHDTLCDSLSQYSSEQHDGKPPRIYQPHRSSIVTGKSFSTLVMPVSDTSATGIKAVTLSPKAPVKGHITVSAADGKLLGLLNAAEITAFRTALVTHTLVSRSRWSRKTSPGPYNLLVFGSGKQAEWHIRLALRYVSLSQVTLANRGLRRLEEMDREVLDELRAAHPSVSFKALAKEANSSYESDLKAALLASDLIYCTTPSTTPLFPSTYLGLDGNDAKARFLSLIGSYKPNMQEVDTATMSSAAPILVDSKGACLQEAGELIRDNVTPDQLLEMGQLFQDSGMSSKVLGPGGSNVVFKCVGMALMDLVIARQLLEISRLTEHGRDIEEF